MRRTVLGWPCLFHLGCETWCLRISAFDLRRIRPKRPVYLRTTCSCAPPRRSSAPAVYFQNDPCIAAQTAWRQAFLGFFSPSMRLQASAYPSQVPSRDFVDLFGIKPRILRSSSSLSTRVVQMSPSRRMDTSRVISSTSRVRRFPVRPLRASLAYLPGLFHPSGILGVFPFRGLTHSEPEAFQLAMPFFSLANRFVVLTHRTLRPRAVRSDELPVFTPTAKGCRLSPILGLGYTFLFQGSPLQGVRAKVLIRRGQLRGLPGAMDFSK